MIKAYEMPFNKLTINPAVDFKEKRYTFVTVNAEGNGVTPAAGAAAIGVIQEPNSINEPAQVIVGGVSFIVLGGTVTAGQAVEVGADGKAVAHDQGVKVGICLVGGESGDIGSVLI